MNLSTLDSFFIQPIEVLEESSQAKQFQSICLQHTIVTMTCALTHWKCLRYFKPGIPVSTFMYFTYTSFIISPSPSITNSYSSRKYWSDSLIPRLPWGLERPGTKKFPLIRITEVALTRVSFMLGACWNMISMISLCKLVVRPVAGPDQLRLLAQCWKHKLFSVKQ